MSPPPLASSPLQGLPRAPRSRAPGADWGQAGSAAEPSRRDPEASVHVAPISRPGAGPAGRDARRSAALPGPLGVSSQLAEETTAGRRGPSRPGLQTLSAPHGQRRPGARRRRLPSARDALRWAPSRADSTAGGAARRGSSQSKGAVGSEELSPALGWSRREASIFRPGERGFGWGSPSDEFLLLSFAQRRARVLSGRRSDGQPQELSPRKAGAAAV